MKKVILEWLPGGTVRGSIGCWIAYFEGRSAIYDAGQTKEEAIHKLKTTTQYTGPITTEEKK